MPRLLLLRHAKAMPARPGASDHDRPLAERGIAEADAVGRAMAQHGWKPDLVLCSTALRTRQTWEGLAPHLGGEPETRFLRSLFDAGRDYLPVLQAEGVSAESLLLVGHNPAVQQTGVVLLPDRQGRDAAALARHVPPAALAILDFDGPWSALQPGAARLVAFLRPGDEPA
jgi:phosphohistidine phosphatase